MVTSFEKSKMDKDLEHYIPNALIAYRNYKKWFEFPYGTEGYNFTLYSLLHSSL